MPSLINETTAEIYTIEQHKTNKLNETIRQNSAYQYLVNYNYNGSAPMINHTWTAPTGDNFQFDTTAGEFAMNGTQYSGLDSSEKRVFFKYLNQFIVKCLENYDTNYNF